MILILWPLLGNIRIMLCPNSTLTNVVTKSFQRWIWSMLYLGSKPIISNFINEHIIEYVFEYWILSQPRASMYLRFSKEVNILVMLSCENCLQLDILNLVNLLHATKDSQNAVGSMCWHPEMSISQILRKYTSWLQLNSPIFAVKSISVMNPDTFTWLKVL